MTRHNLEWKKKEYEALKTLAAKYPVIGLADLENFPAGLSQQLRKQLSGRVEFRVSKTRVLRKALQDAGFKELSGKAAESCAVVLTEMNPFELFAELKKNKGAAPAKAGMAAPEDIVVLAGDTGLPPGPALSDLKAAGLEVRVQGPTIAIANDRVVTKKGEAVSPMVAAALTKLDIRPFKVGLNLTAVLEDGQIYGADVLDIDEAEMFGKFCTAHNRAVALALEACYPASETVPLLIGKAAAQAKALALEAGFCTKETLPLMLALASAEAEALKAALPGHAPEVEKEEGAAEAGKKEEAAEGKEEKEEKEVEKEEGAAEGKEGEKKEGGKKKEVAEEKEGKKEPANETEAKKEDAK